MTTSADDLCIRSLSVVRETASKSDGSPSLSARDSLKRVDMQGLLYSQMSVVFANILFIRPIAYCDGHSGSIRGKKRGAIHMAVGG